MICTKEWHTSGASRDKYQQWETDPVINFLLRLHYPEQEEALIDQIEQIVALTDELFIAIDSGTSDVIEGIEGIEGHPNVEEIPEIEPEKIVEQESTLSASSSSNESQRFDRFRSEGRILMASEATPPSESSDASSDCSGRYNRFGKERPSLKDDTKQIQCLQSEPLLEASTSGSQPTQPAQMIPIPDQCQLDCPLIDMSASENPIPTSGSSNVPTIGSSGPPSLGSLRLPSIASQSEVSAVSVPSTASADPSDSHSETDSHRESSIGSDVSDKTFVSK